MLVTIGIWVTGGVSGLYFISFLLVSVGLGFLLTTAALALEEFSYHRYERRRDIARLVAYAAIESVGYHQIHNVWRTIGYVDIARGKTSWGAQQRRGFATTGAAGGKPS